MLRARWRRDSAPATAPFVRPISGCMTSAVPEMVGMRITGLWKRLRALIPHRRAQVALSIRVTTAALAALLLAQLLRLPLPLWAVLTAVIVTQMSVGRSLKATFDYLVGTLGGAIYGGAIGILIPYGNEIALLGGLALAVAPLALIAAVKPRFSVAPITAIIVVLIPTMTHATAISSAVDRCHRGRARRLHRLLFFVSAVAGERPSFGRRGRRPHARTDGAGLGRTAGGRARGA